MALLSPNSKPNPHLRADEHEFLRRIRGNIRSDDPRKREEAVKAIDERLKRVTR